MNSRSREFCSITESHEYFDRFQHERALIPLLAYPTNNTQQTVLDSRTPVHRFVLSSCIPITVVLPIGTIFVLSSCTIFICTITFPILFSFDKIVLPLVLI